MENLEFAQDTTLTNNGIYKAKEPERATSVERVVRLEEDLADERERHLRAPS